MYDLALYKEVISTNLTLKGKRWNERYQDSGKDKEVTVNISRFGDKQSNVRRDEADV